MTNGLEGLNSKSTFNAGGKAYAYYRLAALAEAGVGHVDKLPYSLKILLENLLRHQDGRTVTAAHVAALAGWDPKDPPETEIAVRPARTLLQDFTGVPCVVDLAAMRDAMAEIGGDPKKINPLQDVELVIDHSVQADAFGTREAFQINADLEFERNGERYALLKWGQKALQRFRVLPPDTGIVHQVNLEYLARVVFDIIDKDGTRLAYPDTLVGTDSHTTMINGLGVLGWGVGGIEAEAAMLGQPVSLLIPEVIGFKLYGSLPKGSTATDLVLTVAEMLRKKGCVDKFVEFFGPGLSHLGIADRATIGNMSPEYGSTCAIFPIDEQTLEYLRLTGRSQERVDLVRAYAQVQGLFRTDSSPDPIYTDVLELDLSKVEPCIAGPRRPQDRVPLRSAKEAFSKAFEQMVEGRDESRRTVLATVDMESEGGGVTNGRLREGDGETSKPERRLATWVEERGGTAELREGAVVIAAITSCTNTSNPSVMIGAGLLAKKAVERGLQTKPWVKTSLAPGSKVVTDYLDKSGLTPFLEKLGFYLVGYGCTTCIGNSGPLPEPIAKAITENDLVVCSVLSGNRNFEARIHPQVRANYLASPPLVVAYALAGTMDFDLVTQPLGVDGSGQPVLLRDIWPTPAEIDKTITECVAESMFRRQYADAFGGDERWRALAVNESEQFAWNPKSTYVKRPPFLENVPAQPEQPRDIKGARVLALLGDSITTDHISPAGSIGRDTPAGKYLISQGVDPKDFNSYGARRGHDEVMVRGTFANVRLRNKLVPNVEGGYTRHFPSRAQLTIFDASVRYRGEGVPLIVIGGKEYGGGSSRDWAAKGPRLLGVRAVIAESFERIHRSNLIGMGILPLEFEFGLDAAALGLTGEETYDISGITGLSPGKELIVTAHRADGGRRSFTAKVRIDTPDEAEYYKHDGILPFVLRQLYRQQQ